MSNSLSQLRAFKGAISEALGNGVLSNLDINSARARCSDALCAVGELLKGIGAPAGQADTFYMLAEAVGDLDVGSIHPLLHDSKHPALKPIRFPVRPPDTSERGRQRAFIALA